MQVHFYATLRPIVGARSVAVELPSSDPGDPTVRTLVDELARRWPDLAEHLFDEDGALSRRVSVFIDGRNARWLEGEASPIPADAKVDIFPPVAGG